MRHAQWIGAMTVSEACTDLAPTGPPDPASVLLADCMRESRNRWRALVALGADIAFETDRDGRFVMLYPEFVLGWRAARLIGTLARDLLAHPSARQPAPGPPAALFDPFAVDRARRRRRVWFRHADGSAACLLLSSEPLADPAGGVRGLGTDITVQDRHDARLASDLLQQENVGLILARMRDALLPAQSLAIALEELVGVAGGEGSALLLLAPPHAGLPGAASPDARSANPVSPGPATRAGPGAEPGPGLSPVGVRLLSQGGSPWPGTAWGLGALLLAADVPESAPWQRTMLQAGLTLLLCAAPGRFGGTAVLALWRETPDWSGAETGLARTVLQAIQPAIEQEQIQREIARQSRADLLTGLLNRQGFEGEVRRRFDRLDRDGLYGTLLVIGLDGLRHLNTAGGLEAGDAALVAASVAFNSGVRPTDLTARLNGDLFALWLDGADHFAAAERAEVLARNGVPLPLGSAPEGAPDQAVQGGRIGISIGLATRTVRSFEPLDSLLRRAAAAMRAVKLAGGGRWLVSGEEPMP